METYSESAEGVRINEVRVQRELMNHGFGMSEWTMFLAECPASKRDGLWNAGDVLRWLGY